MLERVKKPFPLANISNWLEKLLDALNYLHTFAPPIVHREIKPQNLKLSSKGEIKLLFFNVNKTYKNNNSTDAKLNYLPLEQIWDGLDTASQNVISNSYDEDAQKNLEKPIDASSDIYALGATLYHLLTAQIPVDALERSIEILEGKSDPLPSPHEINPSVPKEISEVLMKALEIRRENRFHSALIMRQVWRTAFVRVKERELAEASRQEDVLEIPLPVQNSLEEERRQIEQEQLKIEAEHMRLEEERRMVEQEKLKIEAEQKRQAELLEQQKREAEEQQLKAAQIAEAEKFAVEEESEILEIQETLPPIVEAEEDFPEFINEVTPVIETVAPSYSANENAELFAEPQTENKTFKKMAAFAAVLIILGGAAFGIWFFTASKPADSNQTTVSSEQTAPSSMNIEAATMSPKTETTPEANLRTSPSKSPQVAQTSTNLPTVKAKTTPAATPKTEVKKPQVATAKTPEKPKKVVTVDDLINDN